ncbi:MAG: HAD family phosphatase [Sedimentisphaerales bacterium]|nr:HAD family phosphatase [Sedimentisphaerales bacterium]
MTSCNGNLGVIFDMDGVLVDTGWAHRRAWHDLAEMEGLAMSDDFFRDTFGMQNAAILPMMRPGISAQEVERLSDWKERRYRDLVQERLELAEGAEALLRDLKHHGFRLAIGSSAPSENLDVFWNRLALSSYFDARVTKEETTESKPSPQTFLKAAQKLGLPPACCAVVEDAVPGVQAAHAAGMPVVAVTTTRSPEDLAKADRVVDSLSRLTASDFHALLRRAT